MCVCVFVIHAVIVMYILTDKKIIILKGISQKTARYQTDFSIPISPKIKFSQFQYEQLYRAGRRSNPYVCV